MQKEGENTAKKETSLPVNKLTADEIIIADYLKDKERVDLDMISSETGLDDVKVLRALQWLSGKGFIVLEEREFTILKRTQTGLDTSEKGLPERRFLEALKDGPKTMQQLQRVLDKQEFNVSLGMLKRQNAIELGKEVSETPKGKKMLDKGFAIEKYLEQSSVSEEELSAEDSKELITRGLFEKAKKKRYHAQLKDAAKDIDYSSLSFEEQLTGEMIRTGAYKKLNFRAYDVTAQVPEKFGGRRHFINEATEFVRQVWLDMGFKEMRGGYVQTSFWDFDALFTPQDHPARDMQDTFFLKNPEKGKLPDNKMVRKVKRTHQDGWTTKSTGYGYDWMRREASKNVLRTHTTALSARMLSQLSKEDLPAKFFSVAKVFRNETLDWKHLFEFDQVEGIVVDPNVNFSNLKGYLEIFFKKLGYDMIRIRPAYFPYTEMSVEVDVYHPIKKQWVELGGAGIFRPEVVKPLLGKDVPVLAWGLGFGRIISEYFEIEDLREFYNNDLSKLRSMKGWL